MKGVKFEYTDEMREFIRDNYVGISNKELTDMFNERFGTDMSVTCMSSYKKRHKFNSGLDGRFKKGQQSFNKGKKQTEYMSADAIERTRKTRFKKGNVPINHRQIGSTRITKDGYVEIKVAEPNKWTLRSRYVWKQEHGEIPKGYALIHKNGISTDDSIDNLMMISRNELLRLNQDGLFSNNVECNEVAINIAKVKAKVYEVKKHGRKRIKCRRHNQMS